jgi:hypothetical protein
MSLCGPDAKVADAAACKRGIAPDTALRAAQVNPSALAGRT